MDISISLSSTSSVMRQGGGAPVSGSITRNFLAGSSPLYPETGVVWCPRDFQWDGMKAIANGETLLWELEGPDASDPALSWVTVGDFCPDVSTANLATGWLKVDTGTPGTYDVTVKLTRGDARVFRRDYQIVVAYPSMVRFGALAVPTLDNTGAIAIAPDSVTVSSGLPAGLNTTTANGHLWLRRTSAVTLGASGTITLSDGRTISFVNVPNCCTVANGAELAEAGFNGGPVGLARVELRCARINGRYEQGTTIEHSWVATGGKINQIGRAGMGAPITITSADIPDSYRGASGMEGPTDIGLYANFFTFSMFASDGLTVQDIVGYYDWREADPISTSSVVMNPQADWQWVFSNCKNTTIDGVAINNGLPPRASQNFILRESNRLIPSGVNFTVVSGTLADGDRYTIATTGAEIAGLTGHTETIVEYDAANSRFFIPQRAHYRRLLPREVSATADPGNTGDAVVTFTLGYEDQFAPGGFNDYEVGHIIPLFSTTALVVGREYLITDDDGNTVLRGTETRVRYDGNRAFTVLASKNYAWNMPGDVTLIDSTDMSDTGVRVICTDMDKTQRQSFSLVVNSGEQTPDTESVVIKNVSFGQAYEGLRPAGVGILIQDISAYQMFNDIVGDVKNSAYAPNITVDGTVVTHSQIKIRNYMAHSFIGDYDARDSPIRDFFYSEHADGLQVYTDNGWAQIEVDGFILLDDSPNTVQSMLFQSFTAGYDLRLKNIIISSAANGIAIADKRSEDLHEGVGRVQITNLLMDPSRANKIRGNKPLQTPLYVARAAGDGLVEQGDMTLRQGTAYEDHIDGAAAFATNFPNWPADVATLTSRAAIIAAATPAPSSTAALNDIGPVNSGFNWTTGRSTADLDAAKLPVFGAGIVPSTNAAIYTEGDVIEDAQITWARAALTPTPHDPSAAHTDEVLLDGTPVVLPYTLQTGDAGKALVFRTTATNANGSTVAQSAPMTVLEPTVIPDNELETYFFGNHAENVDRTGTSGVLINFALGWGDAYTDASGTSVAAHGDAVRNVSGAGDIAFTATGAGPTLDTTTGPQTYLDFTTAPAEHPTSAPCSLEFGGCIAVVVDVTAAPSAAALIGDSASGILVNANTGQLSGWLDSNDRMRFGDSTHAAVGKHVLLLNYDAAAKTAQLYRDGVLIASDTTADDDLYTTTTRDWSLMAWTSAGGIAATGKLYGVFIRDEPLSPVELNVFFDKMVSPA